MMGTAGQPPMIDQRHDNGIAVAAGVLRIVGVVFGLVPILAAPALCRPRGKARA
jgi:hypothetical protein